MAETKEKEESPIDKYKRLKKHAKIILDTQSFFHREAYNTAEKEHLLNKEGNIDYERLKDNIELQEKFANTISNVYLEGAKKQLAIGKKLSELEENMLLNAYFGINKQTITEFVKKHQHELNFDRFFEIMSGLKEEFAKQLYSTAAAHISRKHLDEVVKYTGADKYIKYENLSDVELKELLANYETYNSIQPYLKEIKKSKPHLLKEEKNKKAS